jgi:hypothetical protein
MITAGVVIILKSTVNISSTTQSGIKAKNTAISVRIVYTIFRFHSTYKNLTPEAVKFASGKINK